MEKKVWSTADIIDNRNNWSLAADAELLKHLEHLSEKLFTKCNSTINSLNSFENEVNQTSIEVANTNNKFKALSDTQFIESKVTEENIIKDSSNSKDFVKLSQDEDITVKLKEAINNGFKILDTEYDIIPVVDSDSESEEPQEIILKSRNPYLNRRLPYLIGSEDFSKYDHLGLGDELSEEEEEDDSDGEKGIEKREQQKILIENKEKLQNTALSSITMKSDFPPQTQIIQVSSSDSDESEENVGPNDVPKIENNIKFNRGSHFQSNSDKNPSNASSNFAAHLNATLQNVHNLTNQGNTFIPPHLGDVFSPPPFPNKNANESSSENDDSDFEDNFNIEKSTSDGRHSEHKVNFRNTDLEKEYCSNFPTVESRSNFFSKEQPKFETNQTEKKTFDTSHDFNNDKSTLSEPVKFNSKSTNVSSNSNLMNTLKEELNAKLRNKLLPTSEYSKPIKVKPSTSQPLFNNVAKSSSSNIFNDEENEDDDIFSHVSNQASSSNIKKPLVNVEVKTKPFEHVKSSLSNKMSVPLFEDDVISDTEQQLFSNISSKSNQAKTSKVSQNTSLFKDEDDNSEILFPDVRNSLSSSSKPAHKQQTIDDINNDLFVTQSKTSITKSISEKKSVGNIKSTMVSESSRILDLFGDNSDSEDDLFAIIKGETKTSASKSSSNDSTMSKKLADKSEDKNDLFKNNSIDKKATVIMRVQDDSKNVTSNLIIQKELRSSSMKSNNEKSLKNSFENDDLFVKDSHDYKRENLISKDDLFHQELSSSKLMKNIPNKSFVNSFENDQLFKQQISSKNDLFNEQKSNLPSLSNDCINNKLKNALDTGVTHENIVKNTRDDLFPNNDLFTAIKPVPKSKSNDLFESEDRSSNDLLKTNNSKIVVRKSITTKGESINDDLFNKDSNSCENEISVVNSKLIEAKDESTKINELPNDSVFANTTIPVRTNEKSKYNVSDMDALLVGISSAKSTPDEVQSTNVTTKPTRDLQNNAIKTDDNSITKINNSDRSAQLSHETKPAIPLTETESVIKDVIKDDVDKISIIETISNNRSADTSKALGSRINFENRKSDNIRNKTDTEELDGNTVVKSSSKNDLLSEKIIPGKLAPMRSLNINVNALLPGSNWSAAIKEKEKQKQNVSPIEKSVESNNTKNLKSLDSFSSTEENSFDNASSSNNMLNCVTKKRAKITNQRRPPTRRGIRERLSNNVTLAGDDSVDSLTPNDNSIQKNTYNGEFTEQHFYNHAMINSENEKTDNFNSSDIISNTSVTVSSVSENSDRLMSPVLRHPTKDRVKICHRRNLPSLKSKLLDIDQTSDCISSSSNDESESKTMHKTIVYHDQYLEDLSTTKKSSISNQTTLNDSNSEPPKINNSTNLSPTRLSNAGEIESQANTSRDKYKSASPTANDLFSTVVSNLKLSKHMINPNLNSNSLFDETDDKEDDLFNDIFKEQTRKQSCDSITAKTTSKTEVFEKDFENDKVATSKIVSNKMLFDTNYEDDLFSGKSTTNMTDKMNNDTSTGKVLKKKSIFDSENEEEENDSLMLNKKKLSGSSQLKKNSFFDDNDDTLFNSKIPISNSVKSVSSSSNLKRTTTKMPEKQRIVKLRSEIVDKDPLSGGILSKPK